ncbi:MAG: NADH-quinone oxidoreductase subunit J [Rhodospirillaceae bacterium]
MIVETCVFYFFAITMLLSGVMVISVRNPVHSVLYLILAFFLASGLFILLGAEFLAMTLVIVYVGAVAVLFLFVVMMLDISFNELRHRVFRYLPIGAMLGVILLVELVMVMGDWVVEPHALVKPGSPTPPLDQVTNTAALGHVLYTDYVYIFQSAGLILLIAMLGAIVLTLRNRAYVRHQDIAVQTSRLPSDVVTVRKVKSREGI